MKLTPIGAMLAALFMMLLTLVILTILGHKPDSPVLLGLASGVTGMAGAIGGFSMNSPRAPLHVTNLTGASDATVNNNDQGETSK
jgi:hypothetical protein